MSSRKDERRANSEEIKAIDRTIEETKDSTKKVIQEAKRELPEATATFHDFQEENFNAIREMTTTYLDSQKEVAKSMQATFRQYGNNPAFAMMFWPLYNYWLNPQTLTENYVRAATNVADTAVAAVKLSNDTMQASIESTRAMVDYARRNVREMSRLNAESAKVFEQISENYARASQTA